MIWYSWIRALESISLIIGVRDKFCAWYKIFNATLTLLKTLRATNLPDIVLFKVYLQLYTCLIWIPLTYAKWRNSRLAVFCQKDVLNQFAKFTGIHLCQSLFLNKAAGLKLGAFSKKRLWHVFSCEFCQIFGNTFFYIIPPLAASVNGHSFCYSVIRDK